MPVIARAAVAGAVNAVRSERRRSSLLSPEQLEARQEQFRRIASNGKGEWRKANIGWNGNEYHDRCSRYCRDKIRDKTWFSTSLIGVIFFAGLLVGISTYRIESEAAVAVLEGLDLVVVVIFIGEVVVKVAAEGATPLQYFRNAWNVFDFTIVVVGLLPFEGGAVKALRLVRLLRVLKLVRALPKLRILVMGLFLSMSSIAYIGLLLMLLFYLFAVLGVSVFGQNDPVHFGTLHFALLTLFRCATLEDWTDVMYINMFGCSVYGYDGMEDLCVANTEMPVISVGYFVTFTILSSMMILNLFIGVITSSMAEAKSDLSDEADALADAEAAPAQVKPLEERLVEEKEALTRELLVIADELTLCAELEALRKRQPSAAAGDGSASSAALAAEATDEGDEHWMTPADDEGFVVEAEPGGTELRQRAVSDMGAIERDEHKATPEQHHMGTGAAGDMESKA